MKVFRTEETTEVQNYPYGRLRTSATFGTEFKPGKGYRTTFQTVNPRTGILNKVKYSTYSPLRLMVQNEETKFVSYFGATWYKTEDKIKFLELLATYYSLFTPEQIEHFALYVLAMSKVDFKAALMYSIPPDQHAAAIKALKVIYEKPIKLLCEIAKTKENKFTDVLEAWNFEAIENLKDEKYNPFTIRTSQPISIMDM